jgi:mannose-6-phosphate isomerase-like protein (cupin superfamily)
MATEMEFLKHILPADQEAKLSWHHFNENQTYGPYKHVEEDEYLVLSDGHLITKIDGHEEDHFFEGGVNYIYIPKNTEHSYVNLGKALDFYLLKIKK